MSNRHRLPFPVFALLAASLCLSAAALADNTMETITITAGVMTKTVMERSAIGVPTELVTVSHRVSYADLNLATHSGAMALKRRVETAARMACEQLDKLYPNEEPELSHCIHLAVRKASGQVDRAIMTAEHQAKQE